MRQFIRSVCLLLDEDKDATARISDVIASVMTSPHRLRLCRLTRRSRLDDFGFSVDAERYAMVQRVGRVVGRSPAEAAGLRVNDRIVEVNGLNVETDSHHELMRKIAAAAAAGRKRTMTLLVVDPESDEFFHDLNVPLSSTQPFVEQCRTAPDLVYTDLDAGKILLVVVIIIIIIS